MAAVDVALLRIHQHREGDQQGLPLCPRLLPLAQLAGQVNVEGGAGEGGALGAFPGVSRLCPDGDLWPQLGEGEG